MLEFDAICEKAKQFLIDDGRADTVFFAEKENDEIMIFPLHFSNVEEKDTQVRILKLLILAHNIKEYIIVSESWVLQQDTTKVIEVPNSINDHPDRIECLNIIRMTPHGNQVRIFKINRDDTISLELIHDDTNIDMTCMDGIIIPLPAHIEENDQQIANSILTEIGLSVMTANNDLTDDGEHENVTVH